MNESEINNKLQLCSDMTFLYFQHFKYIMDTRNEIECRIREIEARISDGTYSVHEKISFKEFLDLMNKKELPEFDKYSALFLRYVNIEDRLPNLYSHALKNYSIFQYLMELASSDQIYLDSIIRIFKNGAKFEEIRSINLYSIYQSDLIEETYRFKYNVPIDFISLIINSYAKNNPYDLYNLYRYIAFQGVFNKSKVNDSIKYYIDKNTNFNLNDFFCASLISHNKEIVRYIQTLKRFDINKRGETDRTVESCLIGNESLADFNILQNPNLKLNIDYIFPATIYLGHFNLAMSMLENPNLTVENFEEFLTDTIEAIKGPRTYPDHSYHGYEIIMPRMYTDTKQKELLAKFIIGIEKRFNGTEDIEKAMTIIKKY